jgi:CHAT domain
MTETVSTNTLPEKTQRKESRFRVNVDLYNERLMVNNKKFVLKKIGPGDISDYNSRFIKILEDIRISLTPELSLSEADYVGFMKKLRDLGAETYALLSDETHAYIEKLDAEEGERGLTLDFSFPTGMELLWQMVYIGGPLDDPVDPRKFWGFRYPIGHLVEDGDFRDKIKLNNGVFASMHDELTHSEAELKNLEQMLVKIKEAKGSDVIVRRIDEAMTCEPVCSDELFKVFNGVDFKYGVVHFACHCVNQLGASQAFLQLTAKKTILELSVGRFNALARQSGFRFRPLVFLNACESQAPLHFLQALNFPSALVNFGAGGVIATACTLPDEFASAFAGEFYQRLIEKTRNGLVASIGETLMETSGHFLETKKNPLGLAYGLYSTTDQQLLID